MVNYAYTDSSGRKITQTAYDAQKKSGADVSGYKPISTTTNASVLPSATVNPPVSPTPTTTVPPVTTTLPISKESDVYKKLVAKGYDDKKIIDLYNQIKAKKTPEEQEKMTKQEPKKPSTAVDPMAEKNQGPATTQTTAPATQTATPPASPTPAAPNNNISPLTPLALSEYQDNSTERQNNIVNNLNSYRQSNPEFLTNLDTFRKTFSYGLRSDEQKQLLDNWYLGYKKGVELNNTTISSLLSQYSAGTLTDNDMEQLRLNNPGKYEELRASIDKQDTFYNLKGELYETEKPKTIMQQLDEVSTPGKLFEEYRNVINGDEVKGLQTELSDKEGQINQLKLDLSAIKDDVEKAYEGSGATRSKINAIIADQQTDINNKISALSIDYNTILGKYNSIVNTAKETMQLGIAQQQAEYAARNQKMQELGFYYQYDPVGMTERANIEFEIKNPDINSPDPNTARRALNNELTKYYEKYGDIIMRPQSQVLNDVLAQAKSEGLSLSQALKKNFTDPLQAKSLYGQTLGKNLGIDMGSYNMVQGADGNWNISQKQIAGKIVNINGIDYMQDEQGNLSIPQTPYMGTTYAGSGMAGAGLRNNNPGNIKDTGFGDVLGTDSKGFAQFATPEDGFDALVAKIKNNQTNPKSAYYGKTIAQYISKYAPSSDNNNPIAYAQSVAKALGVSVNTKVSDVDAIKFAAAIAKHDSGYDYSTYGQFRGASQSKSSVAPLSDDQRVVFNNQLSSFRSNAVVKSFEDGMTQYSNIKSSLEDVSGPGDVAAIFQFMKALDPTSVVREGEFKVAAESAGVVNQIGNTFNKLSKGQRLTPVQREAFGKLAKQFIINRGASYDRLYDDLVRVTDNMGIDRSYIPTRATSVLYSSPTTPTTTNYSNIGGYSSIGSSRMSSLSSLID